MIAQLILGGVILLALGGAFLSWKADIRAEGEQRILEQVREQQAERDRENLRLAQEGEQEAKRLLGEAQKRNRQQAKELAAASVNRRAESDARAKADIDYALWREQSVPRFAVDRLRLYVQSATDNAGRGDVSTGAPIPAPATVPADTGSLYERLTRGIRSLTHRTSTPGVEGDRPSP